MSFRRRSPFRWAALGASAAVLAFVGTASAQTVESVRSSSSRPLGTALDLGLVTEVPIMIGGQATLELPYGFLVRGEAGAMPGVYAEAVSAVAIAAGADKAVVAPLLRDGLAGAFVGGVSAGMRPFPRLGLEVLGGYSVIMLGSSVDAAQVANGATGMMLPAGTGATTVTLHSTLHNVQVSLGWRWLVGTHFVVRASAGYLQTLASSSHVDAPGLAAMDPNAAADLAAANQAVDKALDGVYRQYIKAPVVATSVAYRF